MNRVQNLRKDADLEITDRILLTIHADDTFVVPRGQFGLYSDGNVGGRCEWTEEESGEPLQLEDGASVWAQVTNAELAHLTIRHG